MRQTLVKRNGFWLVLALIFALISGIGASLVQTAGGNVKVDDLRWETASGRTLNALLFTPPNATADTPAPGIVVSHGWWNNREMQTPNYVELARRGYVVMSIDMYGHGNSDPLPADELMVGGTGMYDAVLQMAELPYVDSDAIGVTGHSNGARAANFSIPLDDAAPKQLISSVLLVDFDPIYTDADGAYANAYGTRDVGLIQAQYDEFFFRSYDADGAQLTVPRDYLTTPNAQSFLNFGADPADGEQREGTTVYTQSVDGTEAMRVVYSLPQTHPWTTTSSTAVGHLIDYFDESLGAPEAVGASNQVWQFKEFFTALGLVAFGILLVALPRALLTTPAFRALAKPVPAPNRHHGLRTEGYGSGGDCSATVPSFSGWKLRVPQPEAAREIRAHPGRPSLYAGGRRSCRRDRVNSSSQLWGAIIRSVVSALANSLGSLAPPRPWARRAGFALHLRGQRVPCPAGAA